jgi:cation diffusion facilitator family transporter
MLVDSAFLHVMGDMIMSVGVIIAATLIYFRPSMWYMDPICTYFFSIIVVVTTIPIVKKSMRVLMEGAPGHINVEELRRDIFECNKDDIHDVHDLHVWSVGNDKVSLTVHVVSLKPLKSLARVTDLLRRKYNLHHTTIQVEGVNDKEINKHYFKCENDIHP